METELNNRLLVPSFPPIATTSLISQRGYSSYVCSGILSQECHPSESPLMMVHYAISSFGEKATNKIFTGDAGYYTHNLDDISSLENSLNEVENFIKNEGGIRIEGNPCIIMRCESHPTTLKTLAGEFVHSIMEGYVVRPYLKKNTD